MPNLEGNRRKCGIDSIVSGRRSADEPDVVAEVNGPQREHGPPLCVEKESANQDTKPDEIKKRENAKSPAHIKVSESALFLPAVVKHSCNEEPGEDKEGQDTHPSNSIHRDVMDRKDEENCEAAYAIKAGIPHRSFR